MRGRVIVLVAVACAAGCGSGGSLSKKEYASKLDAMCADFRAREEKIGAPQSVRDIAKKGPRIVAAFDDAIRDKVRKLDAPKGLRDEADRFVDLANRQHQALAGLVKAARKNDYALMRKISNDNTAINEQATALARKLGATGCAG